MDLVEQIDLTVNPPLWGAIDRRNRVVCEPAPLIYYHPARERDPVPESSTAMGSRDSAEIDMPGENGVENASPATVATVPPETPVTEGTDIVMDDEMSQQKHLELVAIDGELEKAAKEILDRLGREQLPHFVGDEQIPAFESRVQEWINNLPADQKDDGGVVATLLVAGAVRKADVNERFALEAQKSHRLKMAAEAEAKAKELLMKQLAAFDVAKYLVESTKEQREFYGKIQKLLTELKAAVEEPMTLDPQILPGLTTLVADMNKLMEGQSSMQHHSLSAIQGLTKQIGEIGWELHASSIDRRCIPRGTSHSGAWLRESLRETILCSRMALGELVEVARANHEILQQDHQVRKRNCEVNESMLQVLTKMEKRDQLREKVEAEVAKKRKEAAIASIEAAQKLEAEATKTKEAEAQEVQRLADEATRKRKIEELDSANKALEEAQKKAKALESELNQGTPVKNMPARPRMIQTPTVPVPEPLYPPTPAVPEPLYPPGYLPPQMQMVPPAGWAPMTPGSQMGYGMPTGPMMAPPGNMMAPPGPVMSPTAPMAAPMAPPPAPGAP